MSELFPKVQATPIDPKVLPTMEVIKAEVKKKLDQDILNTSKEIGLRNTMKRLRAPK